MIGGTNKQHFDALSICKPYACWLAILRLVWCKYSCHSEFESARAYKQLILNTQSGTYFTQAGWFLWPDCAPSSECPSSRICGQNPRNDADATFLDPHISVVDCRCTPPRRQYCGQWLFRLIGAIQITVSIYLSIYCCCMLRSAGGCRNGKLQNVSPPSVLFESSRIFYNTQETPTQKMMDQNFEIRILWFLSIFGNFQKGIARSLCGRPGPLWSRPN